MSKRFMLSLQTRFGCALAFVLVAALGCMVEAVVNDDGTVDVVVTEPCLFGDFEGDATYRVTSQAGEADPFEINSTSRHILGFGADFKPISAPVLLGLLATSDEDNLTDAPEIDFFEESGSTDFSWVTREEVGDNVRHVRTDATFEVTEAEFTKISFRIRFSFFGVQFFFDDESDDPQTDSDADSVFDLQGEYTLEGNLMGTDTLQYNSATMQVASDRGFDFEENIDATGEGTFRLGVRTEFQ